MRLFNSAFVVGVILCAACGRTSLLDDGGLETFFTEGPPGTSRDADADEQPAFQSCSGAMCAGVCTELIADPSHCGSCTFACAPSQVCAAGACRDNCATGQAACGGGCVDLARDVFHCGLCGNNCASSLACLDGVCACPGSRGVLCGGVCVNLDSDPNNCGGCGNACFTPPPGSRLIDASTELYVSGDGRLELGPGSYYCAEGACGLTCPLSNCCPDGLSVCGRHSCVDLSADDLNCGACGVACRGGGRCSAGKCACPGGLAYCDGACIDVQASAANCGACGATCPAGATCVGGTCVLSCPVGQVQCGTKCVDLSSTKDHCGFCDQVCNGSLICLQGRCGCPTGLSDCAGYCVDLTSNPDNCGSCGTACRADGVCSGGVCL